MDWIGDVLERPGALEPRADAILAPGRRPLTYSGLAELAGGVAGGLSQAGLGEGARVALVVENGPEAACAFLALARSAAVAPLNPAYRAQELAFYLEDIRADALVVAAALDTPAREVAGKLGIRVLELTSDDSAPAGVFAIDGVPPAAPLDTGPGPDAVALLLHTSGRRRGRSSCRSRTGNLAASAGNVAATLDLTPTDRCLNVMPLFHIHGLVAGLLASLRCGRLGRVHSGFPRSSSSSTGSHELAPHLVHGRPDHARRPCSPRARDREAARRRHGCGSSARRPRRCPSPRSRRRSRRCSACR